MEKEDFINNILNSIDGIIMISPNDMVLDRIKIKINDNKVSAKTAWLAAGAFAILISLNIAVIQLKINTLTNEFASFDNDLNKNNQIY